MPPPVFIAAEREAMMETIHARKPGAKRSSRYPCECTIAVSSETHPTFWDQ